MKFFNMFVVCIFFISCSTVPYSDFKVTQKRSLNTDNVKVKIDVHYPNENIVDATNDYMHDFYLDPVLAKCDIQIYHEVFENSNSFAAAILQGLSLGTLGIVPYKKDVSYKTTLVLKSKKETIEKSINSEKLSFELGWWYLPGLIYSTLKPNNYFTNNLNAKMYQYQIYKLSEELKNFKCD